jgi:hypothetical protein
LEKRSPEKAGGGGSIPSLATVFSITYNHPKPQFCSILFQKNRLAELCLKFWNATDCSAMASKSSAQGNGCGMRAAIYARCSTTNEKRFGDVSAYLQNLEA